MKAVPCLVALSLLLCSLVHPAQADAAYHWFFDQIADQYTGAVRPLREWTLPYNGCCQWGPPGYNLTTVWAGNLAWPNEPACEYSGRHQGVDIQAPYHTPVRAFGAGRVVEILVEGQTGFGNAVVVKHVYMPAAWGGEGVTYATYAHFRREEDGPPFEIKPDGMYVNATVLRGTTLGYVGCTGNCTGPHLHFQVDKDSGREHPDWFGDPDWDYTPEVEWYTWNPLPFVDSHYVMLALEQSEGHYYYGISHDWYAGCHCNNEDREIDFEWGYGPAPFDLYDNYSVKWVSGKFCVQNTGWTLFILTTDDGAIVWVDGQQIFNAWYDQPPTSYGTGFYLEAGVIRVR